MRKRWGNGAFWGGEGPECGPVLLFLRGRGMLCLRRGGKKGESKGYWRGSFLQQPRLPCREAVPFASLIPRQRNEPRSPLPPITATAKSAPVFLQRKRRSFLPCRSPFGETEEEGRGVFTQLRDGGKGGRRRGSAPVMDDCHRNTQKEKGRTFPAKKPPSCLSTCSFEGNGHEGG